MHSNAQPVWAVVPASGSGIRMQRDMPKQYLPFQGKTIVEHCLDRLLSYVEIEGVVIVLRDDDQYWEQLSYRSSKPVLTASGGIERHYSVINGLQVLRQNCGDEVLALVHDVVRPLVTHADLAKVINAARVNEAGAILASPVSDTLKLQGETMHINRTISREGLWRAFTPQVFRLELLMKALQSVIDDNLEVTDDASAVEKLGYKPELIAGAVANIKITTPDDLKLAEQIWLHQVDQQHDK